jgi:DNA polymerase (family X)
MIKHMNNTEIAGIFQDISDLLEIKGENKFKVRAYQRAARAIENLPKDLEVMVTDGEDLKDIPGVGDAIALKITEIIETGKLKYYEDLKGEFPKGITTLLEVPGVGPKTAKKLSDLGVNSVEDLEKSILDGRFAGLFRLGEKSAENILHQIQNMRRKDVRIPLGDAVRIVDEIFDALKKVPGVRNLTPAGSLRRFRDTVGDIDLMGTADKPEAVIDAFVQLPLVEKVIGHGATKASVLLKTGLQIDLRMVEHDSFGSLLQYFTGSKQHNIMLRTMAVKMGLSLSEYGITVMKTGELEKFATEEAFYKRLGLQYIPPEIREAQGEIELAAGGKLPGLVELQDIKGDFHVHTDWSDGHSSLEEMIGAARDRGYKFVAVTDHSQGLGIAGGMDPEKLKKQVAAIKTIGTRFKGFRILVGMEVDIRADGSTDLPGEVLGQLDIVVAAIHSGMNESRDRITKRVLSALSNPDVDVLAHPTCRVIGSREPVDIDMEAVFKAALKNDKALEINAMPNRLDLKDVHTQRARDMGIKLTIGTDSHRTGQLANMRFGVGVARRGWCRAEDIINTWSLDRVEGFLHRDSNVVRSRKN